MYLGRRQAGLEKAVGRHAHGPWPGDTKGVCLGPSRGSRVRVSGSRAQESRVSTPGATDRVWG